MSIHLQVSKQGEPQMQPPFDLNLMMPSQGRDPRELFEKAEVARQLKLTKTNTNASALGWQLFWSIGVLLKNRTASSPVSSPF
jgi:hypothetical protein